MAMETAMKCISGSSAGFQFRVTSSKKGLSSVASFGGCKLEGLRLSLSIIMVAGVVRCLGAGESH